MADFHYEASKHEQIRKMLKELTIPVHRVGYGQLHVGISRIAENQDLRFQKELYPLIATLYGHNSVAPVEAAMRNAITYGWKHGSPEIWSRYFPDARKPPSNKQFITTLADLLYEKIPSRFREGYTDCQEDVNNLLKINEL